MFKLIYDWGIMGNKIRQIIGSAFIMVLGIVLCVYGLNLHSTEVSQQKGNLPAIALSEPDLIREASRSGVTLDENSGKIKQTYTGEPPEDCAT